MDSIEENSQPLAELSDASGRSGARKRLPSSGVIRWKTRLCLLGNALRWRKTGNPVPSFLIPILVLILMFTGAATTSGAPKPPAGESPVEISLPSADPSGDATNDQIYGTFYPALPPSEHPMPAVILLHPLGEGHNRQIIRFAHYLAQRGIGGLVMMLPYHMAAVPPPRARASGLRTPMWTASSRQRSKACRM